MQDQALRSAFLLPGLAATVAVACVALSGEFRFRAAVRS